MSKPKTRRDRRATRRSSEPTIEAARRDAGAPAARAVPRQAAAASPGATARPSDPQVNRIVAVLLAVVALLAYAPAIGGGFVWDDDAYVTANVALRDLDGLRRIWLVPGAVPQYYPLTFTTFWFEHQLFGSSPLPYHLTNALLHVATALLIGVLLRRLAVPGAWLAAALFALHPVQVESVAWVTERKNVLSGLLYVAAALAYVAYSGLAGTGAARDRDARPARERRTAYALALVLFVGALLSKTVTATLPAAILLIVWWRRGRITWDDVRLLVPFFAVGLALSFVTVWMEKTHVGASGIDWQLSFIDRALIAGRALWFYAASLVWPVNLTFIYPRWRVDAGTWWQYLFPLAAATGLVALYVARERVGRGPVVAVAFFALTLLPALGFFDVYPMRYSFVADHFQYLASLGLLTLAAAAAFTYGERLAPAARQAATALGAVVLLALAVLTWRQGRDYAGEETLWRATIARNPQASMAHLNLGILLAREGRLDEAIGHYRETLAIDGEAVDARNNLGNALVARGDVDGALAQYQAALQTAPNDASTHVNLANTLATAGRFDEARAHYTEALRLRPSYADAHANLGTALARAGETGEAVEHLREAVRLDPDFLNARLNLAHVLADSGAASEAATQYRELLRRRPNASPALVGLAWLLATSMDASVRDGRQAIDLAERARRAGGDDAGALDTLAAALAESGRFEDAGRIGTRALELAERAGDGDFASAIRARLTEYAAGTPHREG